MFMSKSSSRSSYRSSSISSSRFRPGSRSRSRSRCKSYSRSSSKFRDRDMSKYCSNLFVAPVMVLDLDLYLGLYPGEFKWWTRFMLEFGLGF